MTHSRGVSATCLAALFGLTALAALVRGPESQGSGAGAPAAAGPPGGAAGGVPAAPSDVVATPINSTEVNLTWERNGPAAWHLIERSDAGGPWYPLVKVGRNENIWSDASCYPSTRYGYRVSAVNDAGRSAPSEAAAPATTAPPVSGGLNDPTGLAAAALSPTSAEVTWTDTNAGQRNRKYLVERADSGSYFRAVGNAGTGRSFTDHGLSPGVRYAYRVRGISGAVTESNYTPAAAVVIPARGKGYPVEPSGLSVEAHSATRVTLSWSNGDPSKPAPRFEVWRARYAAANLSFSRVARTAPGATSLSDRGLSAEQAYVYRVRAVNQAGASDWAAPSDLLQRALFGAGVGVVTASAGTGRPKTYEVGPGRALARPSDLDWRTLGPGDTVNIHFRPEPYDEILAVTTRGTAAAPITVNGVPDPATGRLPVFDGSAGVVRSQFAPYYAGLYGSGVINFWPRPGAAYGFRTGHIVLQNLDLRGAFPPGKQTLPDPPSVGYPGGQTFPYKQQSMGVYLLRADHVRVSGCRITGCGNGIFCASNAPFAELVTDLHVRGNYFAGNTNTDPKVKFSHHVYLESIRSTVEANRFDPPRPGGLGIAIKDRSTDAVVRYNLVVGGSHQVQLGEAQNSFDVAVLQPGYRVSKVYGNVFVAPPQSRASFTWYGNDSSPDPFTRKGVCYYHHNTVVNRVDASAAYKLTLFLNATPSESVDARNNVLLTIPDTPGGRAPVVGLLGTRKNAPDNGRAFGYFGVNWISPGYQLSAEGGTSFTGRAAGTARLIPAPGGPGDPLMVDPYGGDFRLTARSGCRGAARPDLSGRIVIDLQYRDPQSTAPRPTASDLGAFEAPGPDAGRAP